MAQLPLKTILAWIFIFVTLTSYSNCDTATEMGDEESSTNAATTADPIKNLTTTTDESTTDEIEEDESNTTQQTTNKTTRTPEITAWSTTTPEITAEPTTTPEITAEPTTTPEITAQSTTTPEITAESTTTPEITAETTTTPEITAESTTTPEITAESTTTPEITAEPTTTPEITAEPTTTPEITAESTTTPEITAEPTTTPEITAETTTTPEITAEPTTTPEITAEPTTTPEITAESTKTPEITAEPTTTPEITAEPTTTPEITAESTKSPEITAEPTTTPEITAEPTTTPATTVDSVNVNDGYFDESNKNETTYSYNGNMALQGTYTSDLADSTSETYKTQADECVKVLNGVSYSNVRKQAANVDKFRDGSIIVDFYYYFIVEAGTQPPSQANMSSTLNQQISQVIKTLNSTLVVKPNSIRIGGPTTVVIVTLPTTSPTNVPRYVVNYVATLAHIFLPDYNNKSSAEYLNAIYYLRKRLSYGISLNSEYKALALNINSLKSGSLVVALTLVIRDEAGKDYSKSTLGLYANRFINSALYPLIKTEVMDVQKISVMSPEEMITPTAMAVIIIMIIFMIIAVITAILWGREKARRNKMKEFQRRVNHYVGEPMTLRSFSDNPYEERGYVNTSLFMNQTGSTTFGEIDERENGGKERARYLY